MAQTQQIQSCRQSFPSQETEQIWVGAAAPPPTPEPVVMYQCNVSCDDTGLTLFFFLLDLGHYPFPPQYLTLWLCSVGIYQCLLVLPFCSALFCSTCSPSVYRSLLSLTFAFPLSYTINTQLASSEKANSFILARPKLCEIKGETPTDFGCNKKWIR